MQATALPGAGCCNMKTGRPRPSCSSVCSIGTSIIASSSRSYFRPLPCRRLVVKAAEDKGFGGSGSGVKPPVNKRGKPSSRQGQISRKDMEKQAEAMRAIEEAREAAAAATPVRGGGGASQGAVPQAVTDRMLRRILTFSGLPIFGGLLLLPTFYYLKAVKGVDLPNWVAYVSQSITFGAGLLGISYGILSASWEPSREGTPLGFTEFKANLPIALERLRGGGRR